jgi:hypothetical protein
MASIQQAGGYYSAGRVEEGSWLSPGVDPIGGYRRCAGVCSNLVDINWSIAARVANRMNGKR